MMHQAIIITLILLNLGQLGMLIRLRWIDKAIQHLPYLVRMQAIGRENYIEFLEQKIINNNNEGK